MTLKQLFLPSQFIAKAHLSGSISPNSPTQEYMSILVSCVQTHIWCSWPVKYCTNITYLHRFSHLSFSPFILWTLSIHSVWFECFSLAIYLKKRFVDPTHWFFLPNTTHVLISSQETNELVAIKKFKDSEGEWGRETKRERKRSGGINSVCFISVQKMRRSRKRRFGSWRCFGHWSRTTSWSWRRLFAGGGSSTSSLNTSRGSAHHYVMLHAHMNYYLRSAVSRLRVHTAETAQLSIKKKSITMATYELCCWWIMVFPTVLPGYPDKCLLHDRFIPMLQSLQHGGPSYSPGLKRKGGKRREIPPTIRMIKDIVHILKHILKQSIL